MSGERAIARRREILAVVLVLLIGAAIRVVYLLQYSANVPYYSLPVVDSSYYDGWARTVIDGRGYGAMPFYMAPLYPYFLALLYLVSGSSMAFAYVVQSALGLASAYLVYLLARRTFGHRAGLAASVLILLYAPLLYLEPKLMTESLAIVLNLGSLLLLLRAIDRPTLPRFLAAGLVLGLSVVCRPANLITVGLVAAWLLLVSLRRKPDDDGPSVIMPRHLGLLLLGIGIAILPVSMRNGLVGGDSALISTNGGIVFAQANNETATGISVALSSFSGSIITQQQEEMAVASEALGHPVTPSESSDYWFGVGMKFIEENPGKFIRLLGRKLIWSLHNAEPGCSYNLYVEKTIVPLLRVLAMPFALLAGLALFGFIMGRRHGDRKGITLLALYIISIYLSLLITAVSSRYRVPAVPALAVFAGFGLVYLIESLSRRSARAAAVFAACALPFVLTSLVRLPMPVVPAEAWANLASCYLQTGNMSRGVELSRKALKLNPHLGYVHLNLGIAYIKAHKLDPALEELSAAVRIEPDDADAQSLLAATLDQKGRIAEAIHHYAAVLVLRPDDVQAHCNLANSLARHGWVEEAASAYQEALRLSPDQPDIRKQMDRLLKSPGKLRDELADLRGAEGAAEELANVHYIRAKGLQEQGELDKAVAEYRRAILLNPDLLPARGDLGVTLKNMGRLDEAVWEYREALRIRPDLAPVHKNLAVVLYLKGDYAEAWKEVHLCAKYGGSPHPGFLEALSQRMPDPGE